VAKEKKSSAFRLTLGDDDLGVFEFEKLSNSDAYLIENTFGLTPKQLFEGIGEMRAVALDALIWLMYRAQGRIVDKALIRWTFGDIDMEPVEDPTKASAGSNETSGSELSPTSAI
jgi:hypothetical protein